MSNAHESGTVITHTFDDDSSYEYKIELKPDDESGAKVYLSCESDSLMLYPESWVLLRDKIDLFFNLNQPGN